ncbi:MULTISPECIES: McrB family protein [Pseudomonas]|nr:MULTISPECIES: AAA family ATPase [Pseudomonas]
MDEQNKDYPTLAPPNTRIWKLSHGTKTFTAKQRESFANGRLAMIHQDTQASQSDAFREKADNALFYLCHGNAVQGLARFCGPAVLDEDGWLQRPYQLLKHAIRSTAYVDSKKKWTPQGNSTFFSVPEDELPEFEQTLLKPYFDLSLDDLMNMKPLAGSTSPTPSNQFRQAEPGPLNRILFGPPGTGKTYRSVAQAVAIVEAVEIADVLSPVAYADTKKRFDAYREAGQIEFVTFHPSYSYQDFVEGIRPATTAGQLSYDVEPGVLKRIADAAAENWKASRQPAGRAPSDTDRFDAAFKQVVEEVQDEGFINARLFRGANVEVRVAVRGQSLLMRQDGFPTQFQIARSQLLRLWPQRASIHKPRDIDHHTQSFYYAALKLLEDVDNRLGTPITQTQVPLKRYVLVIDEINRGNIAKIFGELITLIEDDKRLGMPNALTVRLPYSPEEQPFGLPPNLYLLGTMNTADRSIALLDTALRRRFDFNELMPDASILPQQLIDTVNLQTLLNTMNRRIIFLLGRNSTLGHAYLTDIRDFAGLEHRFFNRIIPLLQEYFFDDWAKIRMIFKDGESKPKKLHIVRELENDAQELFGQDFDLHSTRACYDIAARLTPEMIRAVYE